MKIEGQLPPGKRGFVSTTMPSGRGQLSLRNGWGGWAIGRLGGRGGGGDEGWEWWGGAGLGVAGVGWG